MASPQPAAERASRPHYLIRFLTLVYLLRFPILTGVFLVAFPPLAFSSSASTLLENLFDLTAQEVLWTTTTTFLAAWSVMVTWGLAWSYARRRFELNFGRENVARGPRVILFGLLALPIIAGFLWKAYQLAGVESAEPHAGLWLKSAMVALGFLLALLLLTIADVIQRRAITPATYLQAPELLLSAKTPVIGGRLKSISERPSSLAPTGKLPAWLCKFGEWLKSVPPFLGNGYIDYDADPAVKFPLLGGYGAALALALIFFLFYAILGVASAPAIGWFHVPALAYLVILVTVLNWSLSCLSFFLDRYRIPVLVLIVAWLWFSARVFPRTDNYFYIYNKKNAPERIEPSSGARDFSRIIIVAANGGGIQSAAWTARVLSGLSEIGHDLNLEQDNMVSPDGKRREISFAKNVRLLSAVSGGSVGAMYFTDAYGADGEVTKEAGERAFRSATRSSLNGLAWGLVFPDFIRSIMPLVYWRMDRGGALEFEWKRELEGREERGSLKALLSDWRRDAQSGKRPGMIFNATIVDTGQPMLFTTVDFAEQPPAPVTQGEDQMNKFFQQPAARQGESREAEEGHVKIFNRSPRYQNYDIPVTTAARLSATFPYVTPAARAFRNDVDDWRLPEYHVVDGGYYDNFGMASLVAWLDAELRWANRQIKDVLIIRIYGAPVGGGGEPETSRGWLYQTLAPVFTLNSVRGAGQFAHNAVESELLKRYWGKQGGGGEVVNIELVTFAYPDTRTPLSWHLTRAQIQNIRDAWDGMKAKHNVNIEQVKCFLIAGNFDGKTCADLNRGANRR